MNVTNNDIKRSRVQRHSRMVRQTLITIIVSLIYILPAVFDVFPRSESNNPHPWLEFILPVVCILAFGVNYIYLVPMLMKRRVSSHYYLYNAVLIISSVFIVTAVHECYHKIDEKTAPILMERIHNDDGAHPRMEHPHPVAHFVFRDTVYVMLAILLAYTLRSISESERLRRRQAQIEANAKSFELRCLRLQLNPHFLFNTLNNIYALTEFSTQRARKAILELSTMLRYLIYEANGRTVALRREIEIIRNFIELSKLRLDPTFNLNISIDDCSSEDATIPPLILLTLVENAFKHCNKSSADAFVDIHIEITADHALICRVENSIDDDNSASLQKSNSLYPPVNKDESAHGIGLTNIRQQLALLYGDKVDFTTEQSAGKFSVVLNIPIV